MAYIMKSAASLRISGDTLNPDEITKILGAKPSVSYKKNQIIQINQTTHTRITQAGLWSIKAKDSEPENLDAQIIEIFEQLSSDLSVWKLLNNQYKIDLFCGLFMNEDMGGVSLSPQSLKILTDRGILLDLDIYSFMEENI